jgi:Xaa-Pro aminopeptidase
VQYTSAIWGGTGRTSHAAAATGIAELTKEALMYVRASIQKGSSLTELDVQQRIAAGMQARGLVGPTPQVATGIHTALPHFVATADNAAIINRGDVLLITIVGKINEPHAIFAESSWATVVDSKVSAIQLAAYRKVAAARDDVIAELSSVATGKETRRGFELDNIARQIFSTDTDAVKHGVGRSIDRERLGRGPDLDNTFAKDVRVLMKGTGFVVRPGLYYDRFINDVAPFGIRLGVSVYLGLNGVEVPGRLQTQLEPLLQ